MRWASGLLYWTAAAGLALPLAVMALASLSDGAGGWPTLGGYATVLADPEYRDAFGLSVLLAAGSASLALLAGTGTALAAAQATRPVRLLLGAGVLLPLATPGIVHAVALRITLQHVHLPPGPLAVLLGHAIHATPYAALMVGARRAVLPPALVDAARDLGASPAACLVHVVLPWLRPALVGAAALAALSSFDDFVRSFFLGGYQPTLPVLMYAHMRGGITPAVDAVATAVVAAVGLAGWTVARTGRR